jgi:hypothetical protein
MGKKRRELAADHSLPSSSKQKIECRVTSAIISASGNTMEYTGQYISPSGISDLCGTVAGMVTSKGSISIGRKSLKFIFVY